MVVEPRSISQGVTAQYLILSGGAIDEGNSGGPVIKGGKVIGVVLAGYG